LLLMDEPVGALDASRGAQMITALQATWSLVKQHGDFITHSMEEGIPWRQVVVMSPGRALSISI